MPVWPMQFPEWVCARCGELIDFDDIRWIDTDADFAAVHRTPCMTPAVTVSVAGDRL